MTEDNTTRVVRNIGSGRTHVVVVPPTSLSEWSSFGAPFTGIALPLVARCGVRLRGQVAVCMQPGTRVVCRACQHISGVTEADEDNMTRETA